MAINGIQQKTDYQIGIKMPINTTAGIAQLVEHNLAKVGVASSSLVSRSNFLHSRMPLVKLRVGMKVNGLEGWVAEWLCSGLQSRGRRFDSGLSLHSFRARLR